MRKMGINSMNDLWMLSKRVAVIAYILMAYILLCFDLEISKSVKGLVVPIYFALNFVFACNYRQVLRKFKLYERILEEILSSGFFSNFRNKELCSLPKLHSRERNLSYPITSVEYRFLHSNREHNAENILLRDNLYKLKSETRIVTLNKSVGTSSNVYQEIPAKLHKCVNDLDNIIQRVKLLNLDYSRILEDTSVVNQNSEMVIKNENLKNKILEDEDDIQHKLESTNCVNEISYDRKNSNMKTWSPLKDLDSVIQRIKSLNLDYIRNGGDTSVVSQNSETVTKKENLKNQIDEEDMQRKLETNKCTKEISCAVKSTAIVPQVPHQVLDTKLSKFTKTDWIRNLDFTSNGNRNLQKMTPKNKKRNLIPKAEKEIKHKYICPRHTKLLASTVKKTNIVPQVLRDLGTKDKLTKKMVLSPKNTPAHCLLASMLEYEGTYEASLSTAKKFIRKIIFIKLNTYVDYLIKIPLNKQDYDSLNHLSNLYLERIELIFYKTIAPIRHNSEAVISLKKHVPKIPMRPYLWNVSFTPHMQELSRKRYINSISMRKPNIKKITQKFQRMFTGTRSFCQLSKLKDNGNL